MMCIRLVFRQALLIKQKTELATRTGGQTKPCAKWKIKLMYLFSTSQSEAELGHQRTIQGLKDSQLIK